MGQPSEILSEYIAPDDVLGGRYVIEDQIAAGAYGAIYLAFDRSNHEDVAIKALPPQGEGSSDTAIGRFERELKVVRNLKHPNIVEVRDYGETGDAILYMVMEYIEGQTLDNRVARKGALPVHETLSITRQMASALSTAHELGVIHRDLKPANIMLTEGVAGSRVKILDFGMAKLVAKLGEESIVALTRDGVAVGTPRYIAPEQARGSDRIGPWTDMYALGLLLYEMATGVKAVQHDSVESAVAEHVEPDPLELERLEEAPEPVRALVRRLTIKDLDDRISSGDEVIEAIDAMDETRLGFDPSAAGRPEKPVVGPPPMPRPEPSSAGETLQGYGSRKDYPPDQASPPGSGARPAPDDDEEDEELELDWEEYKDHAPAEYDPARDRWKGRGISSRLARFGRWLGGAALLFGTTVGAVWAIGAQFYSLAPLHRAMLGLAPLIIALFSVAGVPARFRGRNLCRNGGVANGIGLVLAHLLGPSRFVQGLWNDPAWFLEFLRGVPGGPSVIEAVVWASQRYAVALASFFGIGGPAG